ncbi:hypothetical protein CCACVL1_01159, partial [Corchorus capsularis]
PPSISATSRDDQFVMEFKAKSSDLHKSC